MEIEFSKGGKIGSTEIRRSVRRGDIAPAKERITTELAAEHAADPIKRAMDIMRVTEYLKRNERWRDNMMFIVGINFGLRVSDLRMLRFSDLINDDLSFKDTFPVFEKKTRNTRKRKRNRYITVNDAVCDAVQLYLRHTPDVSLSDFMFRSASHNGMKKNEPLSSVSIDRILKGIAKECGLRMRMSTHSLRKTFAYHQMLISNNDPRKLLLLQKLLGHSSVAQTLDYIGITEEEIHDAYMELNLGQEKAYIDADILEEATG